MKRFRNYITEGSILDPKYVIGHKFVYKGNGFKELQDAGYKKDDVFEVVAFNKKAIDAGPQDGEFTKHFKAPDGKVYSISGGKGAKSGNFIHMASANKAPTGAEWEDVIVYAYNKINNKDTDPETTEVAMKFWSLYEDAAMTIAKNFNSKIKSKKLVQTGRGIGSVTLGPLWNFPRANKTPKTDIASADFSEKISLKMAGGSQLASASPAEGIAIIKSAMQEVGSDASFAKNIIAAMELKMEALITKETTTHLKQEVKKGSKTPEVLDFQKKDAQNKELTKMLESYINQDSAVNSLFAKHVVFEAATGNHKFGSPSSKAAANLLGKFSPTGAVDIQSIDSVNSPLIAKYAKNVTPYVAFKKGSAATAAYATFRLGLSKSNESFDSFHSIVINELAQHSELNSMLTEDFIAEGPMDMLRSIGSDIKRLGKNAINKFKSILTNIMAGVKKALKKIQSAGKNLFAKLLQFFGIDIAYVNGIPSEVSL